MTPDPTTPVPSPAGPAEATCLRFGDVEVDLSARVLRRNGKPVPLRPQAFEVLRLLLLMRPHTISREELHRTVWGREEVSASAVPRAVLEVRRAIDDQDREPALIVNVHGVGYRFQGQATRCPGTAAGQAEGRPDSILSHFRAAEAAFWQHNDPDRTRVHAEQALAAALHDGLRVEAGEALCWLGWLAMWSGKVEAALRHVAHALHLARSENDRTLAARAETVEAYIHLTIDESEEAMVRLESAHPVLVEHGHVGWLQRCEGLLGAAARSLGDLDEARRWCRQVQQTLQSEPFELPRLRAMGNEATLDLEIGDRLEADGQVEAAQQAWAAALSTVDQVLERTDASLDAWQVATSMGQRAQLLSRLGRHAQAGSALDQVEQLLARHPRLQGPGFLEQQMNVHVDRTRILLRAGALAEARQAVHEGLGRAALTDPEGPWMPVLHELAAEIAERSGDLAEALRCARRQQAAHRVLQDRRAQTLSLALQVRSQQDAAGDELRTLQMRVQQLERLNASLLLQLHGSTRGRGVEAPGL